MVARELSAFRPNLNHFVTVARSTFSVANQTVKAALSAPSTRKRPLDPPSAIFVPARDAKDAAISRFTTPLLSSTNHSVTMIISEAADVVHVQQVL